jgi:hydroxyacylglutathione hydrolase
MIAEVIRLYIPKSAQNYNHLVVCTDSRKAAIVDPFNADIAIDQAEKNKVDIEQIWITHEHPDHTLALGEVKKRTHALVYAPETCKGLFDADAWLTDEQVFSLGECQIQHLLTPGHTPGHGIFWQADEWAICGDTLFNAGVGNTKSGDVAILYQTINRLKSLFTDSVKIFVGHDYLVTNLKFALKQQPNLRVAKQLLNIATDETAHTRTITTWAQEKEINLFLNASDEQAFRKLRSLRDQW